MYRIALVGDVMLGRLVDDHLASTSDACHAWGNTREVIQECDLAICNLECVIADSGSPWRKTPKVFHFRSHAKNIDVLTCAGIDVVTLANNHSFDFGYEAFREMLAHLKSAHISYVGAGESYTEAVRPVILKVGDVRVGLLSFTDDMPEWTAEKDRPGVYYVPLDPSSPQWQELYKNIRQAKATSDFLIVSPHWGPNFGYQVQQDYKKWARDIIDAGTDVVFGHSGHIPRGIEVYKNKPIIYSAGDFIDDYAINDEEPNDEGFIYLLEYDGVRPVTLQLHPIVIKDLRAQLAGVRAPRIAQRLLQLSEKFGTSGRFNPDLQTVSISIQGAES